MAIENDGEGVVALPDAGVPADQGLSSLGLIMQLGGTVFAGAATLYAFMQMIERHTRDDAMWLLLVLGLCVGRSFVHRAAGTELLYGRPTGFNAEHPAGPLTGLRRYIAIGIAHALVIVLIARFKFHMPGKLVLGVGLALVLWPAVLALYAARGRFRRFATQVPMAEDKGFEAASILMTVLGVCGVLATGTFLVVLLEQGNEVLSHGFGVLLMFALVMLLIRSVLHVRAGAAGLRETSLDRAVEHANRYANFGVISAFCASGALLLMMMTEHVELFGFVLITGVCWMLLTWPMIVRRFFSDRQFADILAGDDAAVHRRAPDAGLTGLGWLLLAHAVFSGGLLLPQLVGGVDGRWDVFSFGVPVLRSIWWSAGLVTLQAWAGFELVRMSAPSRIIATLYSVVAAVVTAYLVWPVWELVKEMHGIGGKSVLLLGPIAIQFVIPVSTLVLVNRKIFPAARARFRPRPGA
jgi:hypothetical protein